MKEGRAGAGGAAWRGGGGGGGPTERGPAEVHPGSLCRGGTEPSQSIEDPGRIYEDLNIYEDI